MTEFNIGDTVRVREGFGDLLFGSEHTVREIALRAQTLSVSGARGYWRTSRFELVRSVKTDEYLTSLEAFKAKAVRAYPDLDDDPDMAEATKIFDKYMGDNDTPAQVYFKDAIKLGRKLEKEGK